MTSIKENEKILLLRRRHYFVFISQLIPFVIIFIIGIGGIIYLYLYESEESIKSYIGEIPLLPQLALNYYYAIFFFISAFLIFIWQFMFIIFTHYYLDSWIITDQRTIHTELRSLFSRFYSSVAHDRIQDITVDIHGIFPTIFKYGDLKIQTAGAFKKFIFKNIPDPYYTKDILFDASKRFTKKEEGV